MPSNKETQESGFRRIGIGINSEGPEVLKTCKHLLSVLEQTNRQVNFIGLAPAGCRTDRIKSIPAEAIGEHCDLIVVVGGDGNFLRFAKAAAIRNLPLLGVNCGRVGFLTDLAHDDIAEQLPAILNGKCLREEHILLEGMLRRGRRNIGQRLAFNDLVIHSGSGRVLKLELFVKDQFVYREHSDGIIAATPHGSTAYALSAGGPIIVPPSRVIALVNISPQTLSNRPLLLPYNSPVSVRILDGKDITLYADGWEDLDVEVGDKIDIRVSERTARLVHPCNYDFYAACRNKLDWQPHI